MLIDRKGSISRGQFFGSFFDNRGQLAVFETVNTGAQIYGMLLGPISGASPGGEVGIFGYVFAAALACLVVRLFVLERVRAKQIRDYAQRAGLTYIGASLPRSFPLTRTSAGGARLINNAVAGDRNKRELVLFDCKIGYGKGRFSQTVLAVRGLVEGFGAERFDASLLTERVDDWTLIYRPKRLLPPEQIEALLSSI